MSGLSIALVMAVIGAQFVSSAVVERIREAFTQSRPIAQVALLALVLTAIDTLGPDGVAPFIYFQF